MRANGMPLSRAAEGGVGWSEMLARRLVYNDTPCITLQELAYLALIGDNILLLGREE